MPDDLHAPALAAMLRDRHRLNSDARCRYCDESPCDALLLIAAIDADEDGHSAQATRLAAWEAHQCPQYRQHHQSRLVQLRRTIAEREALAARLAAVGAVLRAYRAQHDLCAADPEEGFEHCPCEICAAVGAGEATDGA